MNNISEEETQAVARLLQKFRPGFVPYPIFEQIARIMALPILEIIPLRVQENGAVEVLLIERPAHDTLFAGMLHTPGTVIRATDLNKDRSYHAWPALQRIKDDELSGTDISDPYYVGSMLHASKRGVEQAQLYWVEVMGVPAVGSFYPVDDLPDATMASQIDFIMQASDSFRRYKGLVSDNS